MSQTDGTNSISWSYDASGTMLGFTLNGTPYFYLRNLQNDVVGIYDANGAVVARYEYDAWGNVVSATNSFVANHNPIRYRGYYFDSETGYYYLQSRYYNPEWKRFLNADVFFDTGSGIFSTNMYAYALNDPVNACDPSGRAPIPPFPPQLPPYGNFQPQPSWATNAQTNAATNWHPPMANPPKQSVVKPVIKAGAQGAAQAVVNDAATRVVAKVAVDAATKGVTSDTGVKLVQKVVTAPLEPTVTKLTVKSAGMTAAKAVPFVGDAIGLVIDVAGDYKAAGGINTTFAKRAGISAGVAVIGFASDAIPGVGTAVSIFIAAASSAGGELLKIKVT
jgi:RHS repeat-associated protein